MPEKETFSESIQMHTFPHPGHLASLANASPPAPGATSLAAAVAGSTPPSYPGLQLPSAFMAYHSPLSASLEQRAQHEAARYLWDPTATSQAFHHTGSHG